MGLGAVALGLAPTSSAFAEEVFTSQAAAAHATDSTWIPATAQRAALCLVDTGNDPNPDTTNVVARLSVDGEPGTDRSPDHHGTLMSMIAAAPYNGFGMVGAAPSINVVSVRASRDGVTFGGTDVARAVQRCIAHRNTYNIKVISLSLGGVVSGLDLGMQTTVEDMVSSARLVGLNVMAAAGNHAGSVDWPAAYAPILAVGAVDVTGVRCGFAGSGSEVDLWAPGCPLDAALPDGTAAWASGSSESTAFAAGVLTQLRQLNTELTPGGAEQALTTRARVGAAGPSLDVAAGFAAAGLTGQLAIGQAVTPRLQPSSNGVVSVPSPANPASPRETTTAGATLRPVPSQVITSRALRRLPRPSVRLMSLRDGRLSLSFKSKPVGIDARVSIYARRKGKAFPVLARRLRVVGDRVRTRVSGTVIELSITYVDPQGVQIPSVVVSLRPGK